MFSHATDQEWPTRYDYEIAIENMQNMLDPELRRGRLTSGQAGALQFARSENPIFLVRIDDWMMRCFCSTESSEPADGIKERYRRLSQFYRENHERVSALIPIEYVERGIRVQFHELDGETEIPTKTEVLPLVKMPYISGRELGTFVAANYKNSSTMKLLCDTWLHMIQEMEAVNMAHGDLDLTNVRVQFDPRGTQLYLRLIDYDNTWIPGFAYRLPEYGHEPFQHPAFFNREHAFDDKIDRFSAFVIYLSLKAIELRPDLYTLFGAGETRLLFALSDYQAEQKYLSSRISQLRDLRLRELEPYIDELCDALHENRLPCSLASLAPSSRNKRPAVVEDRSRLQQDSLPEGHYEVIVTDWDHIEYDDEPVLSPISQPGPVAPAPRPVVPNISANKPPAHPPTVWQEPTREADPVYQQRFTNPPTPMPRSGEPVYTPPPLWQQPAFTGHNDSTELYTVQASLPSPQSQTQMQTQPTRSNGTAVIGCLVVAIIAILIIILAVVLTHHGAASIQYHSIQAVQHTLSTDLSYKGMQQMAGGIYDIA